MSPAPAFSFTITDRLPGTRARCGELRTPHGTVTTPNFIFCGTRGAIKGVPVEMVRQAGADIILSNTYHLFLQPGHETVRALGGLQRMTGWNGPMLTDSGGFQIFSLGHGGVANEIKGRRHLASNKSLLKITEEGATFRAYTDGRYRLLTPEISIEVQEALGADLILVLDECTPFHVDYAYTKASMERSHRWALRSLERFRQGDTGRQALYGIVQGGVYPDLREASGSFVAQQPFFGQAVGGSLGGDKAQMHEVVAMSCAHLDPNRPTHLLGIGGISDVWTNVLEGIDTFDCVHPTRLARHGGALVVPAEHEGREHLNLKNARFARDDTPLDPATPSPVSHYRRGYLHHLLKAEPTLAGALLSVHNIAFMVRLASEVRAGIREGDFTSRRRAWLGA